MSLAEPSARRDGVLDRIEAFARSRSAIAAMAAWAAAESIVLPVVPDVGLCLLVLAAPSRTVRLFAAVIAGALVGTLVMAALASMAPDAVRGMLLAIPGIDSAMLGDTHASLTRDGVAGFAQFGPGAPLKVYTAEWVAGGGGAAGLLVGAILNRLARIGPALLVAAVIGALFGPWLRRHARIVLVAYAAFWIAVYVSYLA
jgi:hypothetical protein